MPPTSEKTYTAEMLEALKEAREVCAACFRVIDRCGEDAVSDLEGELAGFPNILAGFGSRWHTLIAKVEGR